MIYAILMFAGLLFSLQFCVNKYFQKYKPKGETASTLFALLGKAATLLIFLLCIIFHKDAFWGNYYTVLVGAASAVFSLLITFFGIRVLAVGSVATYTISMMIGGMAVPIVFGVLLFHEPFGWMRILAFVLIAIAVVLSVRGDGKKINAKALVLYAIIFLCNGFSGVFTSLHSNLWGTDISKFTYMFTTSAVACAVYVPVLLIIFLCERKKEVSMLKTQNLQSRRQKVFFCVSPFLAGILNGVANFLTVIGTASSGIGSVVTFPLTTGGTILFTVFLSRLFYKEKITLKKILSAVLIVVALVIFIL